MQIDAPLVEPSLSLHRLFDTDLAPLFWVPERRGTDSTWWGHVPFALWLTCAARPRVIVELGTYRGVSYAAFCEAARREKLETRCFAVDTWQGDEQSLFYDDRVYDEFREFHDARYAAFSTLLRCTFDEALPRFDDGSVDLLHIDGLHTYQAVRHDFESWLPKLSGGGVVLFHDTNIHRPDFGVWQLWRELKEHYPHFEFQHSCGLGALAVGNAVPQAVAELCAIGDTAEGTVLRDRLSLFAERWMTEADLSQHLVARRDAEQRLAAAEAQAVEAAAQLRAVYASTSWRVLEPVRRLGRRHPGLARAAHRGAMLVRGRRMPHRRSPGDAEPGTTERNTAPAIETTPHSPAPGECGAVAAETGSLDEILTSQPQH